MKIRFLTLWMVLAFAGGVLVEAAEPPAEKDAASAGRGATLCHVVPSDQLTKAVPKQATDKTRADCKSLTEAINKCVSGKPRYLARGSRRKTAGKDTRTVSTSRSCSSGLKASPGNSAPSRPAQT